MRFPSIFPGSGGSVSFTRKPVAGTLTLDALMAKQKELAARQQSLSSGGYPGEGTVLGGLGNMLNQYTTGLASHRAEQEEALGRQELAQAISGVDLDTGNVSQEALSTMMSRDPDTGLAFMKNAIESRRAAREAALAQQQREEERGWSVEDREDAQSATAELARQKAEQEAAQPYSGIAKIEADFRSGRIDQATRDAAIAKETAISGGQTISVDKDGNVVFSQGGTGGPDLGTQGPKNLANALEDYRVEAKAANNLLPTIANMEQAFDNAGYTGPGGDWYGALDDALEATGSPVTLPGTSGPRAVVRGGGLGFIMDAVAKSKGSISDKETALFQAASPGLTTTPEGAKLLLGIARETAKRAVQREAAAGQWVKKYGSLEGFEQNWNMGIEASPIIVPDGKGSLRLAQPGEAWPEENVLGPEVPNPTAPGSAGGGLSDDDLVRKYGG